MDPGHRQRPAHRFIGITALLSAMRTLGLLGHGSTDGEGLQPFSADDGQPIPVRVLGDSAAAPQAAETVAPGALSLPVQFDFDSASISSSAREQLDALAEGIKLLPPERLVVIEGHTDARGTDEYNHQLSMRRAAAVKQYLVEEHGIAAARLRDTGVGKRQPVPDADPFAAVNRRVQFRGG